MVAPSPDPGLWLQLNRRVRFVDTDAAGVMQFHQLLRWCHEAYEESLERFGVTAAEIFPGPPWRQELPGGACNPAVALPIVHCSADFRRPLLGGDGLRIELRPSRLESGLFEVNYLFFAAEFEAARGLTRHRAIQAHSRERCALPEPIERWLKASGAEAARG